MNDQERRFLDDALEHQVRIEMENGHHEFVARCRAMVALGQQLLMAQSELDERNDTIPAPPPIPPELLELD